MCWGFVCHLHSVSVRLHLLLFPSFLLSSHGHTCARTQNDLSLFRWHPALCARAHLWGKSLRSVPNAWLFSHCHLPQLFPFRLSSRSPLVLVTAERKQVRRREMGCGYHGTPDMRRKHNDSLCVDTRSAAAPFYNLQKHRGKEKLCCET